MRRNFDLEESQAIEAYHALTRELKVPSALHGVNSTKWEMGPTAIATGSCFRQVTLFIDRIVGQSEQWIFRFDKDDDHSAALTLVTMQMQIGGDSKQAEFAVLCRNGSGLASRWVFRPKGVDALPFSNRPKRARRSALRKYFGKNLPEMVDYTKKK